MSSQITSGSFVATASTPFFIPLSQQVNSFVLTNQSKLASYTSGDITNAYWNSYMANGTAIIDAPTTNTIASTVVRTQLASNGISLFNATVGVTAPAVAIASFTQGTTAITVPVSATLKTTVWTTGSNHGLQVGDLVKVYSLASAPQFGGLVMAVIAVGSATTFTTLLNSTNATTSTGFVQKVGNAYLPNQSLYFPQNRVIAALTQQNPVLITTLVPQNYQPGDVVTFDMPSLSGVSGYGTTSSSATLVNSYSGLPVQATVLVVNNAVGAQSFTIAFNGVSLNAFGGANGWASSAQGFPYVVPQGEGNINNLSAYGISPAPLPYGNQDVLTFARQNQGYNGILIGAGNGSTTGIIGASADTFTWQAFTSLQTFP